MEILLGPLQEMRLEIEDMSYEEFIALCARICSVSNGLSEDTITAPLKTKFYTLNPNSIILEEFPYDVVTELFKINILRVSCVKSCLQLSCNCFL